MSLPTTLLGIKFIAALIAEGSLENFALHKNVSTLLETAPAEAELYKEFCALVAKCGKIPSKATFEAEIGQGLPDVSEFPKYYWEEIRNRHIHRTLVLSSETATHFLAEKKPVDALLCLQKALGDLAIDSGDHNAMDFKNSADAIMKLLAKKITGDESSVEFGWPTLDEMSSGMTAGDVISFVGRPGAGKTYMMLQSALQVWRVQKKPVLFVSLEMSPEQLALRLAGMVTSVPFEWIKTGGIPTFPDNKWEQFRKVLEGFQAQECSFSIVDANQAASAKDIEALCLRYKPAAVFVDAAYMLSVEGRFGKWERIGEACKELKKLAVRQNVPVIASWQLNRESTKANSVGLQHIAGSDEISQLSSVVLGLFEDENISNARRRKITVLKGRHGEQGTFHTHWCFQTMNFAEADENIIMEVY